MRIFRLILNRIKLIPGKIRETLKIRLIFLNIMTIALFAVLIIRVYGLQIVETRDEDYVPTGSAVRQVTSRYVESVRGEIYDRKGNLLAYNTQSYSIVMTNSAQFTKNDQKNEMIVLLLKIL